jgi:periplasmic protein TonB
VVALLHAASRRPASMDPESRIVVDLVEQPVLLPLAQSERSRPALGPVPQPRKQARKPRAVSPSSPAAAPSTPAPTPTPVRDSALPPASLAPSEPALASASVPAPAAKNQATNLARALPRPATQAGPTLAGPVATAEIEIRLRAATPGCYPYAAIRGNLEGVTKLGFCVGETGRAGQAQIVQSSGSQLLDSAALDCILPAASPFPPGRDVCVTVPIRFQLRP